jgi:hypothetical protein
LGKLKCRCNVFEGDICNTGILTSTEVGSLEGS